MGIFDPPWIKRLKQLPKVQAEQAHRISDLAWDLAQAMDPEVRPGRRGDRALETAASDMAEYLTGEWEFPIRNNPIPQPPVWDMQYARVMLSQAMYAFEGSIIGNPREHGEEVRIRRLALDLALEIMEAGPRNDPEGLLDRMVQGRIGEIPRPSGPPVIRGDWPGGKLGITEEKA